MSIPGTQVQVQNMRLHGYDLEDFSQHCESFQQLHRKSRGKLGLGRNKTEFGGGAAVRLPYVSCMAGRPKAGVELTLNALQRCVTSQSCHRDMSAFGDPLTLGFLPVAAIEEPRRLESRPVDVVETSRVHGDPIRLGARHVKGMHAAMGQNVC
jgi:hypothetical protein